MKPVPGHTYYFDCQLVLHEPAHVLALDTEKFLARLRGVCGEPGFRPDQLPMHPWNKGDLVFELIAWDVPDTWADAVIYPTRITLQEFQKYCKAEVRPEDLPAYLHLPHKAPEFDRILKGAQ